MGDDFPLSGFSVEEMRESRERAKAWHLFEWINDLLLFDRLNAARISHSMMMHVKWGESIWPSKDKP